MGGNANATAEVTRAPFDSDAVATATGGASTGYFTGASATAVATGGTGQANMSQGDTAGTGGAAVASADAVGVGPLLAAVTATGGQGGTARQAATGGAGGAADLVNAARASGAGSGSEVTLDQAAIGGAGGNSDTGPAGAGGGATSILDYRADAGFALNADVSAVGGASGVATAGGAAGGNAAASSTLLATTGNAVNQVGATGGSSLAQGGTATAAASSAGAFITNEVSALSTGSSAGSLTAQTSSFGNASGSTSFSLLAQSLADPEGAGTIDSLSASTIGVAAGQSVAVADTQFGGAMPGFGNADAGVSIAVGAPGSQLTAPVLASNPTIGADFAGADNEMIGELGVAYGSVGTDSEAGSSTTDVVLDAAKLGTDDLRLGLYGGAFYGGGSSDAGIYGGSLQVFGNGHDLFDTGFVSGAQLLADFTDNVVDLGSAADVAANGTVDLSVHLQVTTDAAGGGFYGGVLLGANQPPAVTTAFTPDRG